MNNADSHIKHIRHPFRALEDVQAQFRAPEDPLKSFHATGVFGRLQKYHQNIAKSKDE